VVWINKYHISIMDGWFLFLLNLYNIYTCMVNCTPPNKNHVIQMWSLNIPFKRNHVIIKHSIQQIMWYNISSNQNHKTFYQTENMWYNHVIIKHSIQHKSCDTNVIIKHSDNWLCDCLIKMWEFWSRAPSFPHNLMISMTK
jgi:hypothetical protein